MHFHIVELADGQLAGSVEQIGRLADGFIFTHRMAVIRDGVLISGNRIIYSTTDREIMTSETYFENGYVWSTGSGWTRYVDEPLHAGGLLIGNPNDENNWENQIR